VFLEAGLNAERYVLEPYVDEMPLAVQPRFYFQQDGTPPYFAGDVRNWTDEVFPG
jgi:hypothetical protein